MFDSTEKETSARVIYPWNKHSTVKLFVTRPIACFPHIPCSEHNRLNSLFSARFRFELCLLSPKAICIVFIDLKLVIVRFRVKIDDKEISFAPLNLEEAYKKPGMRVRFSINHKLDESKKCATHYQITLERITPLRS